MMRSEVLLLAVFLVALLLSLLLQSLLKRGQNNAWREVHPPAPPVPPREPTPLSPRVRVPRATRLPTVAPLVAMRQRPPSNPANTSFTSVHD